MPAKLLVPLALLALPLGAAVAQADPAAPSTAPVAFEETTEPEGEEDEAESTPEEECEEATEEFEAGEISQEELEEGCERQRKRSEPGPGGVLPEVCVVRTFDSDASANPDRNTVELTIHYTTFEPTNATISFEPNIGTVRRHLGARGMVRLHEHVTDTQMKKLAATHKLSIKIDIPSTPALCQRYYADTAKLRLR